jgi:hypothetical protein
VGESSESPEIAPAAPPGPTRSRPLVIALRLLLLSLAAVAATAAIVIAARGPAGHDPVGRYVCPMHPEVRAASPGPCPICGMTLEPAIRDDAGNSAVHHQLPGMTDTTAVENIRKHKIMDFVRVRSLLFDTREIRGPGWVEADRRIAALLYDDQIAALGADEPATFSPTQAPTATFTVHRTTEPVVAWDRSTSWVRFQVAAGRGTVSPPGPRPGQVGWVELARRSREVLAVPAAAVLQSPEGPYVLAATGAGASIEKRPIEIGETFLKQGFAVVLSGLRVHDRIVTRAAFFLDADRRLDSHLAEDGWGAP